MPARTSEVVCAEKEHRTYAYSQAIADLNRAVDVLTQDIGVMPREEYEKLRAFCRLGQDRIELYRKELESHISEHGC